MRCLLVSTNGGVGEDPRAGIGSFDVDNLDVFDFLRGGITNFSCSPADEVPGSSSS